MLSKKQQLTPQVLRWVTNTMGSKTHVVSYQPMLGGISTSVYGLTIKHAHHTEKVILRLFDNAEWLKEEPDLARHEANALKWAKKTSITRAGLTLA